MGLLDKTFEDYFWAIVFGVIGVLLIVGAFDSGYPILGLILIAVLGFVEWLCLGV